MVTGGEVQGTDLRLRRLPALDGIRAVAVAAVILYHFGLNWAGGGYLGVDLFFVLSGFLITGLLVEERVASGGISLSRFYARRARRLFPALLLVLGAVVLYAAAGGPNLDPQALRGDVLSTLFYVANWHFIASNNPYFAPFATPSPLEHTWSLAIEEQFYVVWPVLITLLAKIGKRNWRPFAMMMTAVLAVASALDMAVLASRSADISRAYFGTDTRAFALMVGAFLALWMDRPHQFSRAAQRGLHGIGAAALCLIVVGFVVLGGPPRWMFDGGFLGIAILASLVIASVAGPDYGPLGAALSLRPIQWIGKLSYGLYLWHWPVCVFLTSSTTGFPGWAVDLARAAITLGFATVSFYAVEQPIRQRRWPALSGAPGLAAAAATALCVVLVLATIPAGSAGATAGSAGRNPGSGPNVPGAGGFGDEGPIVLPAGLTIDHAHPLRVLVIGDSIMELAEVGIADSLTSTGVVTVSSSAYAGFGLAPGAPFNAFEPASHGNNAQKFLESLVRSAHPQLIIGTWSWDDATAKAYPRAYRRTLDTVTRALLSPGDGVLGVIFLQMPVFGPIPKFLASTLKRDPPNPGPLPTSGRSLYESYTLSAAGVTSWNDAISLAPHSFPGKVMYLPVASSVELHGKYTSWLPPINQPSAPHQLWVRVRIRDGKHLCPAGITRYSAAVLQDLTDLFQLPPAKGSWWAANNIPRQIVNLGLNLSMWCPNDHPPS